MCAESGLLDNDMQCAAAGFSMYMYVKSSRRKIPSLEFVMEIPSCLHKTGEAERYILPNNDQVPPPRFETGFILRNILGRFQKRDARLTTCVLYEGFLLNVGDLALPRLLRRLDGGVRFAWKIPQSRAVVTIIDLQGPTRCEATE